MFHKAQLAVKEFSIASRLPVSNAPRFLPQDRVMLRAKWMRAELDEFIEADDIADQVDAILDLIYYALGVFVEMGIDGNKPFEMVHQANMRKTRTREITYDIEGKVLKPEGWISPREEIRHWLTLLGRK